MEKIIAIELSRYCDKGCPHCGPETGFTEEDRANMMSFDDLCSIIEQIDWINKDRHMRKIRRIDLTGGEPLLWRDRDKAIGDAAKDVKEHGLLPHIITSGTHPIDRGHQEYMEGFHSLDGIDGLGVCLSFNLFLPKDIQGRSDYSMNLFAGFTQDRLEFFCAYDGDNRWQTFDGFDRFMQSRGFKREQDQWPRDWKKQIADGNYLTLTYTKGYQKASVDFVAVYAFAGKAKENRLKPAGFRKECIISYNRSIFPVITYDLDVKPCWTGCYKKARAIGNLREDKLSTILSREKAYLDALERLFKGYRQEQEACDFCISAVRDGRFQFG